MSIPNDWATVIAQISENVKMITIRLIALERRVEAMESVERDDDDEPDTDGKTAREHDGDHQRLWEQRP